MQNLFFDTSALVKRYYDEPGTETVDSLVENDDTKVILTAVTVIETVSAFRRKYNREDLPKNVADGLLTLFFDEALSSFLIVPTEEALFAHSFGLILEDDLRTLDSLQLSAALAVDEEVESLTFVCADRELVSIADKRGLETVNPDTDDGELVSDIESIPEEYFEDASRLFRIFESGEIDVRDEFKDAPWQEQILIHLIGQHYAYESEIVDSPTLPDAYFYARTDADDSAVRAYINELEDDLIVKKEKEPGEWRIVPDNLPKALSRIEGLT